MRHRDSRRSAALGALLLSALLLPACGKKGPPQPPVPKGPLPPDRVMVRQLGQRAVVRFRVPRSRGSNPSQLPVRAELIRLSYPAGQQAPSDPAAFRRRGRLVASLVEDPLASGTLIELEDTGWDELPANGVESTLRYAVRVRDRRSRPSPLVVAPDLVPQASVAAPGGLSAEPTTDGIRLVWQPPAEAAELSYNLYREAPGDDAPVLPLNAEPLAGTEYLDEKVTTGEHYRYFVRTSLAAGRPLREGPSSVGVDVVAADLFAPEQPQGLVAVPEGAAVRLFWNPNPDRDLAGYRIYRRFEDGAWERIGPDSVVQPLFLDATVGSVAGASYRVTALDRASPPNESVPSETFDVELGDEVGGDEP
ncbi:MAG: fibronectin type III domain-containing protein [bacterium]|nr:fibronectin type III domain-containing protein [bacterium]